jgi:quinone-modifying oxidoreductase subunit QmoC
MAFIFNYYLTMVEVIPDIEFKKELTKISRASLNECMQCGTCSVVCSLAPEEKPFPRKEMIWAGWGLKDKLIANTDVWLCHQCGDCSTHCPRGVKPADVLSAVRKMTYLHYARPRVLGVILSQPKLLPVALLIPVFIISVILLMAGTLSIPEGPVLYSKFFPHGWLNSSFTLLTGLSYGLAISGLIKFINDLNVQFSLQISFTKLFRSLFSLRKGILAHSKFSSCKTNHSRKWAHILVFYGFLLLLVVTVFAIVAAITHKYPLKFTNPFKITGNIAGIMLLIGLGMMMINRLFRKEKSGNSDYSDWLLLFSLLLLTLSGIIVEAARFQNWSLAYHLYFFHLVCVWFVVIYLPYTKFGHLLYRTVAIVYANAINRDTR